MFIEGYILGIIVGIIGTIIVGYLIASHYDKNDKLGHQ